MSQLLRKALLFHDRSQVSLQNPNFSYLRLRWFSKSSEDDNKTNSFVVSYLKSSLGFSPEMSQSAFKYVKFDSPDKPDKILELFRNFGFSETEISRIVKKSPRVLLSSEEIISPKLEFLKTKGVSETVIAHILRHSSTLLRSSLSKTIIPSYDRLRSYFESDEKVINAVKRYPDILNRLNETMARAKVLREHGISGRHIAFYLERNPRIFVVPLDRFRRVLAAVEKMGFDRSRAKFCEALSVSLKLSESTWEKKVKMLREECGFSCEEVSRIFRIFPNSMAYSERKLSAAVIFFVDEMGLRPSLVAKQPSVLGLSLKKRIVPRCRVYKALLEKGLVTSEKDVKLQPLLMSSEEKFVDKYVNAFGDDAPELLELYKKCMSDSRE